jgi:hypothetical protein
MIWPTPSHAEVHVAKNEGPTVAAEAEGGSEAARELTPSVRAHLQELLRDQVLTPEAKGKAAAAAKPKQAAGIAGKIAGPLVDYMLTVVINTFVSQVVPQLKEALDKMDADSIRALINGWIARHGGPTGAV